MICLLKSDPTAEETRSGDHRTRSAPTIDNKDMLDEAVWS